MALQETGKRRYFFQVENKFDDMEVSAMRLKNFDLTGAIVLAVVNIGWVQLPDRPLMIGIVLAIPLILFLPGYVITQSLFHNQLPKPARNLILRPSLKMGQPIGPTDYIILSIGLSLAIDVLVGFVLDVFPFGLQAQSWTVSLGLVITVFALLAAYLRRHNRVKTGSMPKPHLTIHDGSLFGLAILVAAAAILFSIIRPQATPSDFTQFWMLQSTRISDSCAVLVGVQSYEATPATYRVVVTVNGGLIDSWSSIVLAPQEKWDQTVSIRFRSATPVEIDARLYRTDESDSIYRETHLTLQNPGKVGNKVGQECTV